MGKFAWFILGLVLGAAIALAAVTLTGRVPGVTVEEGQPESITRIPILPVPGSAADPLQPAPAPPPVRKPVIEARPDPAPVEDDAQVAEDAAAAGLTSRSRRSEPASAPAEAPPADRQD